jgi:drug/metabolite transporter (DMT)-like permease
LAFLQLFVWYSPLVAQMKNQHRAYLFAIVTVLLWSTAATAFKIALKELSNIHILAVANLTSWTVFLMFMFFQRKFTLLNSISLKEWGISAIQGLLNPFAYYVILFKAYSMLPAQVAQPVNFVWPIVLMLLSVPMLKQPLRLTGIIALLVSFSGVLVLATQGDLTSFRITNPIGIAYALLTSVIWATFWLINLKDRRDDLVKLFLSFSFSMVYIVIFIAVTGNPFSLFSPAALPAIYIGLFEMGFTFIFWLKALQLSHSTGKIANLIYITPFLSLLIIHLVLHEQLYNTSIIGLCLIVAGILISQIKYVKP